MNTTVPTSIQNSFVNISEIYMMDKHFDLFTACVNQELISNYSSPFFFGFLAKDRGAIHWVTEGTGQALFQGTEKSRPLYYYPSWYIYIYIQLQFLH